MDDHKGVISCSKVGGAELIRTRARHQGMVGNTGPRLVIALPLGGGFYGTLGGDQGLCWIYN